MTHQLRPYQQAAVDAAIKFMRGSLEPFIIEAATGAGKSLIIAEVARIIHGLTGKRILCTAPTKELVIQNRAKYVATGNPAGMFSASAGAKNLRHPVVFGSPLTVKNRISAFNKGDYALVLVDECDLITPTVKAIIQEMREGNPNMRVMGLTATPFRLGSGYIYREGPDGEINGDDTARDPYFVKSVYCIGARDLIDLGYLTKPVIGSLHAGGYDTSALIPNRQGKFDSTAVDKAYHGHGRKTAAIVGDVVQQSQGRRGVLIYAATVQHAQEVLASLPPELSEIITGETANRDRILKRFERQELKYLVNVGVLTVGVDMPHVDVIAILRKTESVRLLQQIIGRGLRLYPDKHDCLVLDYTSNLEDHCPDGDLFAPIVKAGKITGGGGEVSAVCPECNYDNAFSLNPQNADYKADKHGYCLDVFGEPIMTDYGPMPIHFGRRCFGMVRTSAKGEHERCGYRWTGKDCPHCGEKNDIAARYCYVCKGEIVNPNDKLVADFKALKRDPTKPQTDKVLSLAIAPGMSRSGNRTMRADWVTPYRQFSTWHLPDATHSKGMKDWATFDAGTREGTPETVSYVKDAQSGFFRVIAFGLPEDILNEA